MALATCRCSNREDAIGGLLRVAAPQKPRAEPLIVGLIRNLHYFNGVLLAGGAAGNTIGGTSAAGAQRDLRQPCRDILIDGSDNNTVQRDDIGLESREILAGATGTPATGCVIGGNIAGLEIESANDNTITSDYIGTNVGGTLNLGNQGYGEVLSQATGNTVKNAANVST